MLQSSPTVVAMLSSDDLSATSYLLQSGTGAVLIEATIPWLSYDELGFILADVCKSRLNVGREAPACRR